MVMVFFLMMGYHEKITCLRFWPRFSAFLKPVNGSIAIEGYFD